MKWRIQYTQNCIYYFHVKWAHDAFADITNYDQQDSAIEVRFESNKLRTYLPV